MSVFFHQSLRRPYHAKVSGGSLRYPRYEKERSGGSAAAASITVANINDRRFAKLPGCLMQGSGWVCVPATYRRPPHQRDPPTHGPLIERPSVRSACWCTARGDTLPPRELAESRLHTESVHWSLPVLPHRAPSNKQFPAKVSGSPSRAPLLHECGPIADISAPLQVIGLSPTRTAGYCRPRKPLHYRPKCHPNRK